MGDIRDDAVAIVRRVFTAIDGTADGSPVGQAAHLVCDALGAERERSARLERERGEAISRAKAEIERFQAERDAATEMAQKAEAHAAELQRRFEARDNTICWDVHCAHQAEMLDRTIAAEERAQKAEARAEVFKQAAEETKRDRDDYLIRCQREINGMRREADTLRAIVAKLPRCDHHEECGAMATRGSSHCGNYCDACAPVAAPEFDYAPEVRAYEALRGGGDEGGG